jgi:hypothetical protein
MVDGSHVVPEQEGVHVRALDGGERAAHHEPVALDGALRGEDVSDLTL